MKMEPLTLDCNRLSPTKPSDDGNDRPPIIMTSSNKSDGGGGEVHAPPQVDHKDDLELMTKTDGELHMYIARKKRCFQLIGKKLPDKGEILLATIRRHEIELKRRNKLKLGKETCEAVVKQENCEAQNGNPMQKRKKGRSPILQANGLQKGNLCSTPPDHDEPSGSLNNATMNTKYQQVWPFIKQSVIWATIESLESYPPQKPHFSPL